MDGYIGIGLMHARTFVQVEQYCGSCGRMRKE